MPYSSVDMLQVQDSGQDDYSRIKEIRKEEARGGMFTHKVVDLVQKKHKKAKVKQ